MKQIKVLSTALLVCTTIALYSCGPKDDKGSMDQENSGGEGSIDSTRLMNIDTTSASITIPGFIKKSVDDNLQEIKIAELGKQRGTSNEVKQLAGTMVQQHNQMLAELHQLAAVKQTVVPEGSTASEAFFTLGNAPSQTFNHLWISTMLQMHENTLNNFRNSLATVTDTDVKKWIEKTTPAILEHKNMLEKLDA